MYTGCHLQNEIAGMTLPTEEKLARGKAALNEIVMIQYASTRGDRTPPSNRNISLDM
jgi:hypothetical protein